MFSIVWEGMIAPIHSNSITGDVTLTIWNFFMFLTPQQRTWNECKYMWGGYSVFSRWTSLSAALVHVKLRVTNRREKCDASLPCFKIPESQQSSWTETKSMEYRFVPECNHIKESHTCHFVFCHICSTTVCWNPKWFAAMSTWRNDFSSIIKA